MRDQMIQKIKRKMGKFIVTGVLIALLTCCLAGCSSSTEEQKSSVTETTAVEEKLTYTPKAYVDMDQVDKSEIVYVKAGADGSVNEIKVEAVLKNPGGLDEMEDYSELTDIRNLNGDEEYTKNGNVITWENHGEDITYKGVSDKELPVRLAVTYRLDGNAIAAKDLIGKSGHVTIRFDYTNLTKETVTVDDETSDVIIPLICVSAIPLETDKFHNIHVKNGDVMSMGDSQFAIGFAAPGLQEALGLEKLRVTEDIEIPDYVEVEADVTDFELSFTETIVIHGLFEAFDEEELEETKDSTKGLYQLSKAADQLSKGVDQLYDGLADFQKEMNTYLDGVEALKDGADELESGMEELSTQGEVLVSGMKEYNKGVKQFRDSLASFDSIKVFLPGKLRTSVEELQQGAQALADGSNELTKGVIAYTKGTTVAYEGTKQLNEGLKKLSDANEELRKGMDAIMEGTGKLKTGLRKFSKKGIKELTTTLGDELMGVVDKAKVLKEADLRYQNYSGIKEGYTGSVIFMIETEELLMEESDS